MKDSTIKNMSASVRERLLNFSRSSGRDFQEVVIRYTIERFLARLTRSSYRDQFVLKGAMLYVTWKLDAQRATMDLDLLGFGNPDPEHLAHVFKEICDVTIEDDGLLFDRNSIEVALIREESIYHGVRAIIRVQLGVMPIRLQVDVGFGDVIVPEPKPSEFPCLLAKRGLMVNAYLPETVIAEKFNAIVVLGMANSRMKDYFDIWMLSQKFSFEGSMLRDAILGTFSKRLSDLPTDEPVGLSDEFAGNELKNLQWKGFMRKRRSSPAAPAFSQIVASVRDFILPVLFSITRSTPIPGSWSPDTGWQD